MSLENATFEDCLLTMDYVRIVYYHALYLKMRFCLYGMGDDNDVRIVCDAHMVVRGRSVRKAGQFMP